jgi:hypothetical protein
MKVVRLFVEVIPCRSGTGRPHCGWIYRMFKSILGHFKGSDPQGLGFVHVLTFITI